MLSNGASLMWKVRALAFLNTAMQANPVLFALHIHEQRTGSLLSRSGD